jgi:DNA-binding LytR/AlgR family response regulator
MLKCIVVDDQVQSVQVLRNHIKKISFLKFAGSFTNVRSAVEFLNTHPVELIFLDIKKNFPPDSSTADIFQHNALVIFISAHRKFALDGFDHGVVDFLMKPVLFERFYKAVEKANKIKSLSYPEKNPRPMAPLKGGYIFIKEGTRLLRVELDDIYYVMGLKNYVSILTKTHRIVSLQTMKQMEELLPSHRFIRVHRSYFVALDKIISIEKQQIQVKDKLIPIGNIYLPHFMKKLLSSGAQSLH